MLGLFGRIGFDITPAIGDPVHMGIDTNPHPVKRQNQGQVGRLPPHPLQGQPSRVSGTRPPNRSIRSELSDFRALALFR